MHNNVLFLFVGSFCNLGESYLFHSDLIMYCLKEVKLELIV
jgi:hypothetical protein